MRIITDSIKKLGQAYNDTVNYLTGEYEKFIKESIEAVAASGGVRLSKENYQARLGAGGCADCPYAELQEILPAVEDVTCQWENPETGKACGCIVSIKAKFDKYRNPKTLRIQSDKCPRWAAIDQNFK